jgi:hypothetical protein
MSPDPDRRLERWPTPGRYGSADALQAMGTVAAPLLAGFSVTLATVVLTSAQQIRWPGVTVLLATIATGSMVTSLQFTFWARGATVSPDDMRQWWDDADQPDGRHELVKEMRRFQAVYAAYSKRARNAYNVGIISLLLALAIALVPPAGFSQPALRWTAAALAMVAALFDLAWALLGERRIREHPRLPKLVRRLGQWLVLHPTVDQYPDTTDGSAEYDGNPAAR